MQVRHVGTDVVVVPVGGGVAVAPDQVVDVPTEIGKRLVATDRFEAAVGATTRKRATPKRATPKPRKRS